MSVLSAFPTPRSNLSLTSVGQFAPSTFSFRRAKGEQFFSSFAFPSSVGRFASSTFSFQWAKGEQFFSSFVFPSSVTQASESSRMPCLVVFSNRISHSVACIQWSLTFNLKCCCSAPVVLLSSVATSMLSGSTIPAYLSYLVLSVSHSQKSCSNCSVPHLNSSTLSSKLISSAAPGSEKFLVSKRHDSNPFISTFLRTTSWALSLVICVSMQCNCLLNFTNSVSASSLSLASKRSSASSVIDAFAPSAFTSTLSASTLNNETYAFTCQLQSCHQTRQAVAVLYFLQRQCLQSWPLLSSVVAGVRAPLPWKVLGSFSSTTNGEQS